VYLHIPRRQIYCQHCQKYSTETLDFVEKGRNYTKRYEEYIYERVKELTVEQGNRSEGYKEGEKQPLSIRQQN
jgi:ribosomal protein L44E